MKKSNVDNFQGLGSVNCWSFFYLAAVKTSLERYEQVLAQTGGSVCHEKLKGKDVILNFSYGQANPHAVCETKTPSFDPIKFTLIAVKNFTFYFLHLPANEKHNRIVLKQEVVKSGSNSLVGTQHVYSCMWNKTKRWLTKCLTLTQSINAQLWITSQGKSFVPNLSVIRNNESWRLARSSPGPPVVSYLLI